MSNLSITENHKVSSVSREVFAIIKFAGFLSVAIGFILFQTLLISWIPLEKLRLSFTLRNIKAAAHIACAILGIKINSRNFEKADKGELLVCNHLSYLDVLVLCSVEPALFVTSREIREVFFLGTLAKLGGCFFVERRKHLRTTEIINSELSDITSRIKQGHNVFLFPEGTSSKGDTVLPFKAHFFQLAIDAGIVIMPRVLIYKGQNSDLAPWYGAMTFPDHLYSICREKEFHVELQSLKGINGMDYECKFTLASEVHQLIKDAYARN